MQCAGMLPGATRLPPSLGTLSRSQWPSQARVAAAPCAPRQPAACTQLASTSSAACTCSPCSTLYGRTSSQCSHAGRRRGLLCRQAAFEQGAAAAAVGGEGENYQAGMEVLTSAEDFRQLGAGRRNRWLIAARRVPNMLYDFMIFLLAFLQDCTTILPEFVVPSLSQAVWRTGMVLAASLVMIVVISTIDSVWLYWYVLRARLGA